MAAHVPESSGAEVEAFAPITGVVPAFADEGSFLADTEPEVPVESGRDGVGAFGHGFRIAPFLTAPRMDLGDFADAEFLDALDGRAVFRAAMDLDAHLGDEAAFACDFGDATGFVDVVGEWLLAVDVAVELQGTHGDGCVHVVGGGDIDGVEVLFLVEEFAPVLIDAGVGEALADFVGAGEVDIGDGDDVEVFVAGERGDIGEGHSIGAEAGMAHAGAGRAPQPAAGYEWGGEESGGCGTKEVPSVDTMAMHDWGW